MDKKEIHNVRNHPLYILENSWGAIFFIVLIFINVGVDSLMDLINHKAKNTEEILIPIVVSILILVYISVVAIISIRRWKLTTLSIVDGSLTWERATFFSVKKEIAISTISNVNLEQNLFERIMGIYKLKIDTSSISTAEKTDMKIVLSKENADRVREIIMTWLHNDETEIVNDSKLILETVNKNKINPSENVEGKIQNEKYDIVISDVENIKCAIASISENSIIFAVIFLGIAVVIFVNAINSGKNYMSAVLSASTMLLGVAGMLKHIVNKFLACYNYRIRREKNQIHIISGAVKIRAYSVPVEKIQALRFNTTFLGRILHRTSVSVINVGGEDDDVDGQFLLPAVSQKEIENMLKKILPEYKITAKSEMTSRPQKVFVYKIIKTIIITSIEFIAAYEIFNNFLWEKIQKENSLDGSLKGMINFGILAIGLLMIIWKIIDKYVEQKTSGIKSFEHKVAIRKGGFSWEQVEIPYDKIQFLKINQGPIERILKVKSGKINILASLMARTQSVSLMSEKTMNELKDNFQRVID